MSTIQLAMKEGRCLLIEDIGTNIDPVLDPVLRKKTFVKVGGWIGANPTAKRGCCRLRKTFRQTIYV